MKIIGKAVHWPARLALSAAVLAIVYFALRSSGDPPVFSDKVWHAAAFATVSCLAALAYPKQTGMRVFLVLAGFGALIELAQMMLPFGRDAEIADWYADAASTAVALAAFHYCRSRILARQRENANAGQRYCNAIPANDLSRASFSPDSH